MNDLQRLGGAAALFGAAKIILGIVVVVTVLADTGYLDGDVDPEEFVLFLVDNQALMFIWKLIIWVIWGIALVILAVALHERLKPRSKTLIQVATIFGLIWAGMEITGGLVANASLITVVDLHGDNPNQAALIWQALDSVEKGFGAGNLIVGSLFVLLISFAALRRGGLPKALNYFGVVIGVAGLLAYVPILSDLGIIFGLGLVAWFAWLGTVMLRVKASNLVSEVESS